MPDEEAVFKQITKENWELIADFLDFSRGEIRKHIGYYIWWNGIPGEATWSFYHTVPELHVTITDGYIADRAYKPKKRKR